MSTIDPNAHAETLAQLLEKVSKEAQELATQTRNPNMPDSKDPNVIAQALESNGDPSTMPKSDKDEKPVPVVPTESPNDAAEKLQKELNKAIDAHNLSVKEPETQNEHEKAEKGKDNAKDKSETLKIEKPESAPAESESKHEVLKEAAPVSDSNASNNTLTEGVQDSEYVPPSGSSEDQDSSWQRPDAKDHWDKTNNGEPGPEGAWPDSVYDENNAGGSAVTEGGSSSTDAPADWGTYDDNVYSIAKPAEEKPKESGKPEPEKDIGGGADGDENTWDDDNDPSTPEVVIKGAKFGVDSPKKEDVRTQDVIIAKSVDEKRDKKVGVALSTYNLNYVFQEKDERDHKFGALYGAPDVNYLPATTDLRPTWGSILDQLDLGSCVSNSVSYCIRYCFKKQKLGDFTPSRLFIYFNGRQLAGYPINEDSGLTIRDGFKSVTKYSACSETNWPYVPNKFATRPPDACYVAARQHQTFRYISLDNDAAQIKKCLKDGYPVSFGAALFSSFMSAKTAQSGVVPMPDVKKDQRVGGHAMTIVGHDDAKGAFLVVNNWGAKWGQGGYCWIPYQYITNDDWVGDLWSPRYFGT